jgi:hypothetical protein
MPHYTCSSFEEVARLFAKHQRSREKRIRAAVIRTAKHGRRYIISTTIPIAFGELQRSLQVVTKGGGVQIRSDAPHAAPVETGSRPHWPPLAPLVAWVKKRGAQGLKKRPGRGTTTEAQARGISGMLQAMESGGALDTDAPEQVARAIQRGIARAGTKPHWFMRSAMPEIEAYLDVQIKIAVDDAASAANAA